MEKVQDLAHSNSLHAIEKIKRCYINRGDSCFIVGHIQQKTNFLQISKRLEKTIQVLAHCVFHIVAFAVQDQTRSR